MKHITLLSLIFTTSVSAQSFYDWDNPSKKFDVANGQKQIQLTIVPTDNVLGLCNKEARNRGFSEYKSAVNSCAFWNGDLTRCTIVVPKNTSMHVLGHELLHCIKGNWH
jgi:hypothetical protein